MSDAMNRYLDSLDQLVRIRWLHEGQESPQEDELLEEMDRTWWTMAQQERDHVQSLPTRSIMRSVPNRRLVDTPAGAGPRRVLVDVAREMEAA